MNEEQELTTSENDIDIPEEQVTEQKVIPFEGDELTAALSPGGVVYISLPSICKALGLPANTQIQRIKRTKSLIKGLRLIPLSTRGGFQRTNCLRVDKVALWLAGTETSRMKNEEFRTKIEIYQEELAPVATQVFMRVVGIRTAQTIPTEDPRVIALAEQIDDLTEVATFLREQMESMLRSQGHVSMQLEQAVHLLEALTNRQEETETQVARIDERTQRLTPGHARDVKENVDLIVAASMKQIPTISKDQAFSMIYGRLKRRFRVTTYTEIADERFDEAMAYLRNELRKVTSGKMPEQGGLF